MSVSRPRNDRREGDHGFHLSGGGASRYDAVGTLVGSVSRRGALLDAAGVAAAGSAAPAILDVRGPVAAQGAGRKAIRRAHLQPEAEEPLSSFAAGAANHCL